MDLRAHNAEADLRQISHARARVAWTPPRTGVARSERGYVLGNEQVLIRRDYSLAAQQPKVARRLQRGELQSGDVEEEEE